VIRRSRIHGLGLFATQPIGKGELLGVYDGPRVLEDDTHVLWVTEPDGALYGIDGRNMLRYVNHSRIPNAEFDGDELYALRTIAVGEEISADYGEEWIDLD